MAEFYKNLKENKLFETETLLKVGNLEVHPSVSKISLEGSRGLKGNFHDDSDLIIYWQTTA
jgi:hypothetical protein